MGPKKFLVTNSFLSNHFWSTIFFGLKILVPKWFGSKVKKKLRDVLQEREGVLTSLNNFEWFLQYWTIFLLYLGLSWSILDSLLQYHSILVFLVVSCSILVLFYLWLSLAISCYFLLSLAISGYLRLCLAISGYLCQSLTISGNFW